MIPLTFRLKRRRKHGAKCAGGKRSFFHMVVSSSAKRAAVRQVVALTLAGCEFQFAKNHSGE